ncbi:hypothetical protein Daura_27435 [Dactylosporangium aurantiacum]|uniref:Uncharacterized protein n=1 Tax=Dactylosporangium aurantiacum TaxID=35754 RepID=A0A9Q9MDQ9_9ACTN|nr:hypothetical protein [Dactylosporangium aurantiacum]MDG6106399.1 hypothetical protein [Dactylosporangium aurantiacum]UWZ50560.1 hypothetical protein Daura_27435 [Dactylosporangium aurantiacum]
MQQTETASNAPTAAVREDVAALAGLRETPLSQLTPDRVKAAADRIKQLHRRRAAVPVAKFNSGV